MKAWKALSIVSLVLVWSGVALAQDPVKVDPAHYSVVKNGGGGVVEVVFAGGGGVGNQLRPRREEYDASASGFHRDSAGGFQSPVHAAGRQVGRQRPGQRVGHVLAGRHAQPGEHRHGAGRCPVGRIQDRGAGHGGAPHVPPRHDPERAGPKAPRAMAYRSTASATFAEPAGTKHDFDQVVIALGPAQLRSRSTASLRKRRGLAATRSSSVAAWRMRPKTPVASRWTW